MDVATIINEFSRLPTALREQALVTMTRIHKLNESFHKSTIQEPCALVHQIAQDNPDKKRSELYTLCREAGVAHFTTQTQLAIYFNAERRARRELMIARDVSKIIYPPNKNL